MIRAVVETSVLVSAFIGSPENAPALIVQRVRYGRLTLVVPPLPIGELDGVLARPNSTAGRSRSQVAAPPTSPAWPP